MPKLKDLSEDDDENQRVEPVAPRVEVRDPHPVLIEEATTDQLLVELERRSLACVACVIVLDEGKGGARDSWLFAVQGSHHLVPAAFRQLGNVINHAAQNQA